MKVLVPLGTRPEIVKLAPVVAALRAVGLEVEVVATGQHHDANLTDAFFEGSGLTPDRRWTLEGDDAERVGQLTQRAFREVADTKPDLVLLLGDTYTVPFFALATRRACVPVAHLEAGLRSWNATSMEEVNRRVVASIASLQLAPTELAARFLRSEGIPDASIDVVGNPIIDVLRTSGHAPMPPAERSGVVLTAHRATNVDDPERLAALVRLVHRLADEIGTVTFPLHPRTHDRLTIAGALPELERAGIDVVDPLPWDDMVGRMATSAVIVTDSGGLQEEASYLGVPVVVLRRSTPRWEGVAAGTSVLVGLDVDRAMRAAHDLTTPEALERAASTPCPYGDGRTAPRVAAILSAPDIAARLALDEPDWVDRPLPW